MSNALRRFFTRFVVLAELKFMCVGFFQVYCVQFNIYIFLSITHNELATDLYANFSTLLPI